MTSRLIKAGLAAIALLAVTYNAQAADIQTPVYKGVPKQVSSHFNWTGPYAGLWGGYGWGSSTWDSPAVTNKPKGAMFGGTLGYNWMAGYNFLYGIEGDVGWSGVKSTSVCGLFNCETQNNWLGTVRGRFGFAVGSFLPYMTAGLAVGNIKAVSNNPLFPGSAGVKLGWTVGGGIEWSLAYNWTAKVEYLYVNLGSIDCGINCSAVTPDRVSLTENVVKVGLNYKFGGGKNYSNW